MLRARGITKSFGTHVVLQDVDVAVGPGSRLGLVGPNGIGKSTLLRILAGLESPDSGTVERAPADLQVGWLPQEVEARPAETLQEYLSRRTGVAAAEAELDRLTAALGSDPAAVEPYTEAMERFLALGGDDLGARSAEVCADVGLPADRLAVAMSELSGGQQARAALAVVLLARFDVFLLDEPTNNLDFAGLERLERFLDGLGGGAVVVSHDRAFLDRTVRRILEIDEESHRGIDYAGGWSDYVAARELARSQRYEAFDRFRAESARLTERLRDQRSWADSGVTKDKKNPKDNDRAQRGWRVNRTEKQASKVRVTERALANLDAVDKPWESWRLQLHFGGDARSGEVVARLEGVVVRRGSFTLGPVDLEIGWRERVVVVGPNGGGKTTLLLTLLGELTPEEGARTLGPGVNVGTLDQGRRLFGGPEPVLHTFQAASGIDQLSEARSLLAKFGLGAGHVDRAGARLSPGERSRAMLAVLMATGVNCLVLDEPTNHLDLAAIEELERALDSYEGTLLLVTHDRRLLEAVEVTRTLKVERGKVTEERK
ncbi:MAG: ATP-binding cassette domain-containing protein [Actinobacteria bacterium]|nr:ATP-binding cassette domain-containing protein [Actinomycetota bacterium]MBW3651318.1 ATP-binding cassette domain-containing protein [Actinomycetota bacterium]